MPILAFLSRKDGPDRGPEGQPGGLNRLGSPRLFSIALRLVALALILTAMLLLSIDMLTSLESGGQVTVRSLQQVWALAANGSFLNFSDWLKTHDGWAATAAAFLALPGWGVTGVLGVLLAFLAGRHHGS